MVECSFSRVLFGRAAVFGALLLYAACGGSSVPDVPVDAAPAPDAELACECPMSETLTEDRLHRLLMKERTIAGLGFDCTEGTTIVSGSCHGELTSASAPAFYTAGFYRPTSNAWFCAWDNQTSDRYLWTVTAVCLEPDGASSFVAPEHCDCLPAQPLTDRIQRMSSTDRLTEDQVDSVEVSCDSGGVLIGGGCTASDTFEGERTNLMSVESTEDTVRCTWLNPSATEAVTTADVACVYPPAPGAAPEEVPISERIARVARPKDLTEDSLEMVEASCDFGDTLIWGSCALEGAGEAFRGVKLFRSGFIAGTNRPNTWECGWDIPPGITTAKGTATAVCLKSLSTSTQL